MERGLMALCDAFNVGGGLTVDLDRRKLYTE